MAEVKIPRSGGRTFKVEPMLATEAIRLQARLLKVIGGAIDRLPVVFAGYGDHASAEAKEKSNVAAIAAFGDIFCKGDPEEMTSLVKDIVEIAMVKRPSGAYEQVDLDGDFTGHLNEAFDLAVFVLREQFGPFFSGLLARGSRAMTAGH